MQKSYLLIRPAFLALESPEKRPKSGDLIDFKLDFQEPVPPVCAYLGAIKTVWTTSIWLFGLLGLTSITSPAGRSLIDEVFIIWSATGTAGISVYGRFNGESTYGHVSNLLEKQALNLYVRLK